MALYLDKQQKRLQLKVYQSLQHGYDKHASPLTSLYSCNQYFPFDPVTLFISTLSCYAKGIFENALHSFGTRLGHILTTIQVKNYKIW